MTALPSAARTAEHLPLRRFWLADLRAYWLLWLIAASAIIMRAYGIGSFPGLMGDEAWYGVQAQRLLAASGGELRTPSGNVPGLIQMGSLALLHALFEPSALLLRIPVLLSSSAAVLVAYAIGRRFFGPAAGMTALVLMASLPVNIAYARLSWDPSHAPLLILFASYATLARRRLLAALLFALALSNHPATIFVAPFLTLAFFGFEVQGQPWRPALVNAVAFAGMLGLAILLSLQLSPGTIHYLDWAKTLARIADPTQWLEFFAGFCRLLSGDTIYSFIAGRGFGAWRPWIDGAVALTLVSIIVSGTALILRDRDWRAAGILLGWLVSLMMLFVLAGPGVVRPVFERFCVPMIPLAVLATAVVVGRLFEKGGRKLPLQLGLAAPSLLLLAGFYGYYLRPLALGENRPNPVYWIGLPELNQAAADRIAMAAGADRAAVVAEDWWIHWPVTYRLAGKPLATVDAAGNPELMLEGIQPGGSYWISYRGSSFDRRLAQRAGMKLRDTVETRNGENALNIWWYGPPK